MHVDIVGYGGSTPHKAVLDNPKIHLHLLGVGFGSDLPRLLYLLLLPLKLLLQVLSLIRVLCFSIPKPHVFLLQNPPSIPVLTVVQLACWLRGTLLIIDWHNFGYTLLGLRLGPSHPLVLIHRWYERRYGRRGDAHLCVTKAMQQELQVNWGIKATVLYDRPPSFFRIQSLKEKHELFSRLTPELVLPKWAPATSGVPAEAPSTGPSSDSGTVAVGRGAPHHQHQDQPGRGHHTDWLALSEAVSSGLGQVGGAAGGGSVTETLVTVQRADGTVALRPNRPAIVVSSTSWTADEDFSLLLEAALMYDRRVAAALGDEEDESMQEVSRQDAKGSSPTDQARGEQGAPERSLREGAEAAGAAPRSRTGQEGPRGSFPRLLFIVTGKGPLRSQWEQKMAALRMKRVAFRTVWLSAEDYPRLLGSADLGVSLHTSSSGLDLPMKVVDMFGCSLPVCALAYSCIGELVQERVNGLLFSSSSDLASQLVDLFRGFSSTTQQQHPEVPSAASSATQESTSLAPTADGSSLSGPSLTGGVPLLSSLRSGATAAAASSRWTDEWAQNVLPIVRKLSEAAH